ncbi:MAG TPA: hypothetical protein VF868_03375 [Bacteroidia bacterium]|jgi:hypothetical protein
MTNIRSFALKLAIFSLFTLAVFFLWKQFAAERFQSDYMLPLWAFFILTTFMIHYILVRADHKDPKRFVGYFMGITAIKLFGYLIIITVYALIVGKAALGFTLWFLVLYLLYSGFEVVMLMKHLKK